MNIPNEFHFVFGLNPDFGGKPFSFVHYLAIASCRAVNMPDQINFYYAYEPTGIWWERAKPHLKLVRIDPPTSIYGRKIQHVAHKADVLRLQILLAHGGIYLDLDVVCIRPFSGLRGYEVVMGEECGMGLCNAVLLARPGAEFLTRWLSEYRTFSGENWNFHSVRLPAALAQEMKASIHIVDHDRFFWPMYWRPQLREFFLHPGSQFCKHSYCVHLWESLTWPYLGRLTPFQVGAVGSEFSGLVQQYVDPSWYARDTAETAYVDNQSHSVATSNTRVQGSLHPPTEETVDEWRMILARLPADCREAVILCDLQGMSTNEAAGLLECTAADVVSRLEFGRKIADQHRRTDRKH